MSIDPKELTPLLQDVWKDVKSWYDTAFPTRELFLTCTYRSPEEQAQIYAKGRTMPGTILTLCDGTRLKSKHNHKPSRAFDVAIKEQGRVTWLEKYFLPIGDAIKASKYRDKIRWGGSFKRPKDYPHIEEI